MSLGIGLGLPSFNMALASLDADAAAYIAAIKAAGATVNSIQETAINNFVIAEKSATRWGGLRRIYFPVWGVAAANAIDMKTLLSGIFVGSVTHAAGYVQGDGMTGYFDTNNKFGADGLTASSGHIWSLARTSGTNFSRTLGSGGSSEASLINRTFPRIDFRYTSTGIGFITLNGSTAALISGFRFSGARYLASRLTSGRTVTAINNADAAVQPSSLANVFGLAFNFSDTSTPNPNSRTNQQIGAFGWGLGMSSEDDSAYTANIKTLWEAVTGLVLP